MKKILLIIFIINIFTSNQVIAHKLSEDHYHQISCQGINEDDAIFSISDDAIFHNKSLEFTREWTMKKNVFKGERIYKTSKWQIVIDIKSGEAQMITTNIYNDRANDVFVRNWNNCK